MEYPLIYCIWGFSAAVLLVIPLAAVLLMKLIFSLTGSQEGEPLNYGDDPLENLKILRSHAERCLDREKNASANGGGSMMLILFLLNLVFAVAMVIYGAIGEMKNSNLIVAVLTAILSGGIVGVLALLVTGLLSLPTFCCSACSSGQQKQLEGLIDRVRDMEKLLAEQQQEEKVRQEQEAQRLREEQEAQRKAQIQKTLDQAQKLYQQGAYDESLELYCSLKTEDPQVRVPMLCCLRRSRQTELTDYRKLFRKLQSAMADATTERLRIRCREEIDSMLQQLRDASEADLEQAARYEEEFAYDQQLQILETWADMGLPEAIGLYVSFYLTKFEDAAQYPELIQRLEEALALGFADHNVEEMCRTLVGRLCWDHGRALLPNNGEDAKQYIRKAANWGNSDAIRYLNPPVVIAFMPPSYGEQKPILRETNRTNFLTGERAYLDGNGNYVDANGKPMNLIDLC